MDMLNGFRDVVWVEMWDCTGVGWGAAELYAAYTQMPQRENRTDWLNFTLAIMLSMGMSLSRKCIVRWILVL